MVEHIHGDQDQPSGWNKHRLLMHLRIRHGYVPPREAASTTDGELHQAHLHLHQPIQIQSKAEEAPMSENPDDEALAEEDAQAAGQRQIKVDRLICAMAGIDFDHNWVADEALHMRGAMRTAYGQQAKLLLAWLTRGGVQYVWSDSQELHQLRQQLVDAERKRHNVMDLNTQLRDNAREQQRALQEMAQAQAESESLVTELEGINNRLRGELAREKEHSAGLALQARTLVEDRAQALQRATELETQLSLLSDDLEEITRERDTAQETAEAAARSYEAMKARRDETLQVLRETAGERDRTQQSLMRLFTGRGSLRALVALLEKHGWEDSSVFQRLREILAQMDDLSEPVSTVTDASLAPEFDVAPVEGCCLDDDRRLRHDPEGCAQAQAADQHRENMREDIGELLHRAGQKEADQLDALAQGQLMDDLTWARRFAAGGEA